MHGGETRGWGGSSAMIKAQPEDPTTRTLQPVVTGSSVLGIRCTDGVVMASDTLGAPPAASRAGLLPACARAAARH